MREAGQSSCYTSCWISKELISCEPSLHLNLHDSVPQKEGALKGNQVDVIDYQDWLGCVKIFDTADPTLYQCLL